MERATARQSSQPALEPLARAFAESEPLQEFLADHPGTRARVSEPLLPIFVAGAWLASTPQAGLTVVLADDEDGDAADDDAATDDANSDAAGGDSAGAAAEEDSEATPEPTSEPTPEPTPEPTATPSSPPGPAGN